MRIKREEIAHPAAEPVLASSVTIVLKANGSVHAIALDEARAIYADLKALFG